MHCTREVVRQTYSSVIYFGINDIKVVEYISYYSSVKINWTLELIYNLKLSRKVSLSESARDLTKVFVPLLVLGFIVGESSAAQPTIEPAIVLTLRFNL
jgi:hypothetical protein